MHGRHEISWRSHRRLRSRSGGAASDIAKLTSSVAAFVHSQSTTTQNKVFGAVGNAQNKMSQLSDTASKSQGRVVSTSADLGAAVERNPFISVFVAMMAGFIVGMVSRAGK